MDRRIVIEQSTETTDSYNQAIKTWSILATVWAQVEDKSGSEGYQAEQLTTVRSTVFTIRYKAGIEERMRILYRNRYYDIHSIKAPDRDRTLELTTELLDDPVDEVASAFDEVEFSSAFAI